MFWDFPRGLNMMKKCQKYFSHPVYVKCFLGGFWRDSAGTTSLGRTTSSTTTTTSTTSTTTMINPITTTSTITTTTTTIGSTSTTSSTTTITTISTTTSTTTCNYAPADWEDNAGWGCLQYSETYPGLFCGTIFDNRENNGYSSADCEQCGCDIPGNFASCEYYI